MIASLDTAAEYHGRKAWHVDSWDARGGICFACFGSNASHARQSSELQSVVISPPYFRPTQLADRSLSLAASRSGWFQDGLYLQGRSVPFAALDDLAELVKRAYSGSSSNDPSGGGDGPPPRPVEPGPEPEGPTEPEGLLGRDPQSASSELAQSYREFNSASATLSLGSKALQYSWTLHYLREGSVGATDRCLLRALWLVFDELLKRGWNLRDEHLLNWWRASYAWSDLVQRLHLSEQFVDICLRDHTAHSLALRIGGVKRSIGDFSFNSEEHPVHQVSEFLQCIGMWSRRLWRDGPFHWEFFGERFAGLTDETAYDALWRLPVPNQTAGQFNAARRSKGHELSLGQFISGAINAPALFPDGMPAQHWADLVLLGAASIAAGSGKDRVGVGIGRRRRLPTPGHDRLQSALRREVIGATGAWLSKSLPLLALPAAIENLVVACVQA